MPTAHCSKAGFEQKIDLLTLKEQGINCIPQIHLGSAVTAMIKRGVATYQGKRSHIQLKLTRVYLIEKRLTWISGQRK